MRALVAVVNITAALFAVTRWIFWAGARVFIWHQVCGKSRVEVSARSAARVTDNPRQSVERLVLYSARDWSRTMNPATYPARRDT